MPLELKDVLEYQGFKAEEIDSLEKYKAAFDAGFIKPEVQAVKSNETLYKGVIGNTIGSLKTQINKKMRDIGVTITDEEYAGKAAHEIFDLAFEKSVLPLSTKVKSLEENAGKGNDKKLTELQTAFDTYKAEVEPKIKSLDTIQGEFDTYKTTVAEEKKMGAINSHKSENYKKIPFSSSAKGLARDGFIASVEKEIKHIIDDSGKVIPVDLNGKPFPSTKKAGTYKDTFEILEELGLAANARGEAIWAVAPQNGQQPAGGTFKAKEETPGQGQGAAPQNLGARTRALNTGVRERMKV